MKIYHNPRCSTSRKTLDILNKEGAEVEIIEYLKTPPNKEELKSLIKKLGIKPEELIRKRENIYKNKYKGKNLTDDQWISAMLKDPVLIERPIIVKGNKAVLGRPPEKVLELLK